jgi:hypothetical protein
MPLASVLGAGAVYYGSNAFSYNQNRFTFDKGQQQSCAHQIQSIRMSLWNLFREDVKDCIKITTQNLNLYMLVGVLMLSTNGNMLWYGFGWKNNQRFPTELPWLALFYVHCAYACIAYGVLTVWFAMHGVNCAHSAKVKVLTQAVRPPIATSEDIVKVGHRWYAYEYDPRYFLQLPNAFNWRREARPRYHRGDVASETIQSSVIGGNIRPEQSDASPETIRASFRGGDLRPGHSAPAASLHLVPDLTPPENSILSGRTLGSQSNYQQYAQTAKSLHGVGSAPEAALPNRGAGTFRQERVRTTAERGSGAGPSAAVGEHMQLFKLLQPQYLPFEAYSRASLTLSAHYGFQVALYFFFAHQLARRGRTNDLDFSTEENEAWQKHPQWVSWSAALMMAFCSLLMFKLDLFLKASAYRMFKAALLASPIIACLGCVLWSSNQTSRINGDCDHADDRLPQMAAMAAAVFHLALELLTVWEARPHGDALLPTGFRSVQYTDVFGWWHEKDTGYRYENTGEVESESVESDETVETTAEAMKAARQLSKLKRLVNRLLAEAVAENLSTDEINLLKDLRETLTAQSSSLRQSLDNPVASLASLSSTCSTHAVWLRCEHESDTGAVVHYFVNSTTAEVQWDSPESGRIMDVPSIQNTVSDMCERVSLVVDPDGRSDVSSIYDRRGVRAESEGEFSLISENPHSFAPLRRRPNSNKTASSMAWKYFAQSSCGVSVLWATTALWIAVYGQYNLDYVYDSHGNIVNSTCFHTPPSFVVSSSSPPLSFAQHTSVDTSIRAEQMSVHWPHHTFRPMALACTSSDIMIGERLNSAVHIAPVQLGAASSPQLQEFSPALEFTNTSTPWSALAAATGGEHLFLLESGGAAVLEYPSARSCAERSQMSKRWQLGSSAGLQLNAIVVVKGAAVASLCKNLGKVHTEWALYGTTRFGEVISLCPFGKDRLEPVHVVAQMGHSVELSGISMDHQEEMLWLLVRSNQTAELHKVALDGTLHGLWRLPMSRRWALGLCALSGRDVLALAVHDGPSSKLPELWRFQVETSSDVAQDGTAYM